MIYISADHQGRGLKDDLLTFLKSQGVAFDEVGEEKYSAEDDYPDFAVSVSKEVLKDKDNLGILLCGSGQGMAIAANRFKGIRAGVCWSVSETILARSDDDINVLCLPVEMFEDGKDAEIWRAIVKAFLETEFKDAEKYSRRVDKLDQLT